MMDVIHNLLEQPIGALLVTVAILAAGDVVTLLTKYKIPSTFIIAMLFLLGFWTILPADVTTIAGIGVVGKKICSFLILVHMGTRIRMKEFLKQWRVIVVAMAGLAGMVLIGWVIGGLFVDREYVITGIPPLTGGIIATLMMQEAAMEKGLAGAAALSVCMMVMQGFVGYPLTGYMLRKEGKRLLAIMNPDLMQNSSQQIGNERKLFPQIPERYASPAVALTRVAFLGVIAYLIQQATISWGYFKIPVTVAALVMGIIGAETGFLEKDILNNVKCYNFLMLAMLSNIFGSLNTATPAMILEIIRPMMLLIVFGVTGMGIAAAVTTKIVHVNFHMGFAVALTSLCGFPTCYILTEEASKSVASTPEEYQYLMDQMVPPMMVGNMATVTIASVFIAGFFISLL